MNTEGQKDQISEADKKERLEPLRNHNSSNASVGTLLQEKQNQFDKEEQIDPKILEEVRLKQRLSRFLGRDYGVERIPADPREFGVMGFLEIKPVKVSRTRVATNEVVVLSLVDDRGIGYLANIPFKAFQSGLKDAGYDIQPILKVEE